jgi:hypothetical protein
MDEKRKRASRSLAQDLPKPMATKTGKTILWQMAHDRVILSVSRALTSSSITVHMNGTLVQLTVIISTNFPANIFRQLPCIGRFSPTDDSSTLAVIQTSAN